ncbi:MAG: D-alanyl-D-alanine carboxypeptidase [Acetobacter sp.]|nr:D-alanyl-D-alanine carboxypeptidase [Acetobacter sp.]
MTYQTAKLTLATIKQILGKCLVVIGVLFSCFFTSHKAYAQYLQHVSKIVIDAKTGIVLSQSDPDLQRYPASLTKLMTLYMTFKALQSGTITLHQEVPISIHASTMEPSKLGLTPNMHLTVEQAILALVTKSANDAACALGELLGHGSEHLFATMMTQEAHALGMTNTVFRNASGLPDPQQVTTARDLALLSRRIILDFPEYYHYFSTPNFRFHRHIIPNHNPMLKDYVGADGMKTGYTQEAGHNLVTSAIRDHVRLIGVVMGASSNLQRSIIMADQLDNGFNIEGVAPIPHPLILAHAMPHNRRYRHHRHRSLIIQKSQSRLAFAKFPHRVALRHRNNVFVPTTLNMRNHRTHLVKIKRHSTPVFYTLNTLHSPRYNNNRT